MNQLNQLFDDFELLTDWEDRYRHIIELGKNLTPLKDGERTETNKVAGCLSQVWMVADPSVDGKLAIRGDSDAHIVRGLIAVLLLVYNGRARDEAAAIDIKAVFERLGLGQHLSPNRRNGFFAMVERVKQLAS